MRYNASAKNLLTVERGLQSNSQKQKGAENGTSRSRECSQDPYRHRGLASRAGRLPPLSPAGTPPPPLS